MGVLNTTSTKQTINLSQLKQNSRTWVDKKSGQKRLRPNDTDTEIILAPDSKEGVSAGNESNIIVKKQKITRMLPISDVCKLDELVSLENDTCDVKEENTGRDSILRKQWLTSDHMNNVNKLMQQAGYSINGFQDILLAPVLKKNGMWHIPAEGFNSQRSPSTNIHYNSQKHWVTTIQYENGDIYLLDSDLGKKYGFVFKWLI